MAKGARPIGLAYRSPARLAGNAPQSALAGWRGPALYRLALPEMSLETAKAALDFAFSAPTPAFGVELLDLDEAAWPTAWFALELACRYAEWKPRSVRLSAHLRSALPDEHSNFLRKRGVELRVAWNVKGSPKGAAPCAGDVAVAAVQPGAQEPERWVDFWSELGYRAVRLTPAGPLPSFLRFYDAAMRRVQARGLALVEERTEAFKRRAAGAGAWTLPEVDVLSELVIDAKGFVRGSPGSPLIFAELPCVFSDVIQNDLVQAVLGAIEPSFQPQCCQCAYNSICVLPPSGNLRTQKSLWANPADSPLCRRNMALLDRLAARAILLSSPS